MHQSDYIAMMSYNSRVILHYYGVINVMLLSDDVTYELRTEQESLKELRFLSSELGKQIKKQWDRKESKEEINIKGEMFRNVYERQVREKKQ